MLARRLTTILPTMTLAEAVETTRIHRVAGLTEDHTALVTTRLFIFFYPKNFSQKFSHPSHALLGHYRTLKG